MAPEVPFYLAKNPPPANQPPAGWNQQGAKPLGITAGGEGGPVRQGTTTVNAPPTPAYDPNRPPLTGEERARALAGAQAWGNAVNPPAPPAPANPVDLLNQWRNQQLSSYLSGAAGMGADYAVNIGQLDARRNLGRAASAAELAQIAAGADRDRWGANYSLQTLGRDQGFSNRGWDLADQLVGFDRQDLSREHAARLRDMKSEYIAGGALFAPRHGTRRKDEVNAFQVGSGRLDNKGAQNALGREQDMAGFTDRGEKARADLRFTNSSEAAARQRAQLGISDADLDYDIAKQGIIRDQHNVITQLGTMGASPEQLAAIAQAWGLTYG